VALLRSLGNRMQPHLNQTTPHPIPSSKLYSSNTLLRWHLTTTIIAATSNALWLLQSSSICSLRHRHDHPCSLQSVHHKFGAAPTARFLELALGVRRERLIMAAGASNFLSGRLPCQRKELGMQGHAVAKQLVTPRFPGMNFHPHFSPVEIFRE
jgi:hypothetical protein